jgi:glycerophosphoryl diester phosphodiesterase
MRWLFLSSMLSLFSNDAIYAMEGPADLMKIGHRGCAGLRCENTMAAFHHAFALSLDAIEFDVHLTKDDVIVVNHDYYLHGDLTRDNNNLWVGDESIAIPHHSFQDLQSYRIGKIKPQSSYESNHSRVVPIKDESLPTLNDVLESAKQHPHIQLHIEIKTDPFMEEIASNPYKITPLVLEHIEKSGIKDRCSILAFDWRVLKIVREMDNTIPTVFLYKGSDKISENPTLSLLYPAHELNTYEDSVPRMVEKLGGSFWSVDHAFLNAQNIKEAHELGLKVNAWTPNTEEEMLNLIAMGVDAITTDYPDTLKAIEDTNQEPLTHKSIG